jgi:hypothetical protein
LRRHDRRIRNLALLLFRGKNGAASAAESLADQPRAAVARRHDFAIARVGHSLAGPFDLQSLIPVPTDVLGLSARTTPAALAWLWTLWGTAQALHHVTSVSLAFPDDPAAPAPGEAQRGAELHSSDRDHHTTQSANQYLDERSVVSVVNELSALGSRATW